MVRGLIPFYMSEYIYICSSFKGLICKNFPLFILSSFFMNLVNLWIKQDNKINSIRPLNPLLRFHIKVRYSTSFFFYLMPIGVPRVPFRSPGEEDALWIDVQCDLSDILGIRYFPVLFPDRDIPSFARERLIQLSKIWSVKCNQIHFLGRVYGLILSIRIIYGWLGQTNQMKYPGSVQKENQLVINIFMITT